MALVEADLRAISGIIKTEISTALIEERKHTETLVRRIVSEEIDTLSFIINDSFQEVQERFDEIDVRFHGIDGRLDGIDTRLGEMGKDLADVRA